MPYASIYPLVTARAVARAFTYEVEQGVGKGAIVMMPFGRRRARGIVIALEEREREILDIIYSAGPSSVAKVRNQLSDPPSYSAVRTMLTRLVAKGFLHYKREGMRYVYSPARQKAGVSKDALRRVLNTYFGGSVAQVVNALLDDRRGAITPEEAREIEQRLAAARKAGK